MQEYNQQLKAAIKKVRYFLRTIATGRDSVNTSMSYVTLYHKGLEDLTGKLIFKLDI